MKILLTIVMCSATTNMCIPPFTMPDIYEDYYTCLLDGYKLSQEKTIQLGQKDVNEHEIYMKFGCKEIVIPPQMPEVGT